MTESKQVRIRSGTVQEGWRGHGENTTAHHSPSFIGPCALSAPSTTGGTNHKRKKTNRALLLPFASHLRCVILHAFPLIIRPTHTHSVSHTVIWKELFGESAITMYRSRKRSSCYACRGPSPNAYVVLACLLAYLDRYVLFVRSFLAAFSFIRFAALSVALYRLFCISLLLFFPICVCVCQQ